jgi:hypothetical protein
VLVGADKGFLCNVFCIVGIPQDQICQAKNPLLMLPHDVFVGVGITLLGTLYQVYFQAPRAFLPFIYGYLHRPTANGSQVRFRPVLGLPKNSQGFHINFPYFALR